MKLIILNIILMLFERQRFVQCQATYDIVLQRIESMTETSEYINFNAIEVIKISRKQTAIAGNFTILKDLPDDLLLSIVGNLRGNNGYFPSALLELRDKRICDLVTTERMIVPDFFAHSNLSYVICPNPPGLYPVRPYVPDVRKLPPVIPGENWMIEIMLKKDGVLDGGVSVYFSLVKKFPFGF